jgi:hypothetical protein
MQNIEEKYSNPIDRERGALMRAPGNFQRSQMRHIDSRMGELFRHLRRAIDALEQIALHPYLSSAPERSPRKPPGDAATRLTSEAPKVR